MRDRQSSDAGPAAERGGAEAGGQGASWRRSRTAWGGFAGGVLATLLALGGAGLISDRSAPERLEAGLGSGALTALLSGFGGQIQQDLGTGDYFFLPNRRTVWVINRSDGRFANYHFRDDQDKTIQRSRVVTLDQRDFPPGDTVYLLSDRNLTEVLWVCNTRTGDVQLWQPKIDGNVVREGHVTTSIDLARE